MDRRDQLCRLIGAVLYIIGLDLGHWRSQSLSGPLVFLLTILLSCVQALCSVMYGVNHIMKPSL